MIELGTSSPLNSDGRYTAHITAIAQAGDVATATVEEDGCWGTVSFTSFLSLAKIDGRWQIVARVFAHVSGALPASRTLEHRDARLTLVNPPRGVRA